MAKESKVIAEFLDFIGNNAAQGNPPSRKTVCEYYARLSPRKLNSLISDPYWNKYPMYTCWPNDAGRRSYGSFLSGSVSELCEYVPYLREAFVKKASGILLCFTMDYLSGNDRLRASKRAIKSMDSRARLRASHILPVSSLRKYVAEAKGPMKRVMISRLGLDNCYDLLTDDNDFYYRSMAIGASSDIGKAQVLEYIDKCLRSDKSWHYGYNMKTLLSKLDDEDLLYFLDTCRSAPTLDMYIRKRLSYSSVNSKGGT